MRNREIGKWKTHRTGDLFFRTLGVQQKNENKEKVNISSNYILVLALQQTYTCLISIKRADNSIKKNRLPEMDLVLMLATEEISDVHLLS